MNNKYREHRIIVIALETLINYGYVSMSKYGLWRVTLDFGEYKDEVTLYDMMLKEIILSRHTHSILREQVSKNQHYLSARVIKRVITPFNEDITSHSLFMIMCIFKGMARRILGHAHKLLFMILEDRGLLLLGCGDPEASERKVLQVLGTILDSPDQVEKLIIAYTISD